MNSTSSNILATVLFGSLALFGAGCSGVNTTIDTDTNTVRSDDGRGNTFSAGDGAQIPANFPADFPRYPDAKTTFAYTEANGQNGSLMQETTDSLETVQARVEGSMQQQGFEKTNTLTSPGIVILSYKKGTTVFQINIAQQQDKTMIQSGRVQQQPQE